jgi:hypothetical protein
MAILHDAYRPIASQGLAFAGSAGASAASAAFASQTRWVMVAAVGNYAIGSGVRIAIGDGTPVASASSTLLPVNFPMIFACTPGQKVAAISNDSSTGSLSVTELS